ncbi:MAG TPA: TonB-dependent receptor plug domain-containing protein [Longimicrobiaceae bacterium]|nr:TonB-dependent receptor plug domain-containing protein [Longimicrobiaceae bacterium]
MSSATVIETSRLGRRSGNILSILGSRVANMSVRSTSGCPAITLRGQKSFVLPSNPEVYINGQRANDTCILEMTQVDDVERIEIYPMGVSGRPGYPAHPHGLILVFLRQA